MTKNVENTTRLSSYLIKGLLLTSGLLAAGILLVAGLLMLAGVVRTELTVVSLGAICLLVFAQYRKPAIAAQGAWNSHGEEATR